MNEPQFTTSEIIDKLLGVTDPIGKSEVDAERWMNLKNKIDLADRLLNEISYLRKHKNAYEASVKEIGITANKFMESIRDYND